MFREVGAVVILEATVVVAVVVVVVVVIVLQIVRTRMRKSNRHRRPLHPSIDTSVVVLEAMVFVFPRNPSNFLSKPSSDTKKGLRQPEAQLEAL